MSYFNTLNDFVENAKEANDHLDAIKDDLVASKVSDIRDRFNQHISNIENFGQATLGASGGFHLGRKIYKKIKSKYGTDPAKDKDKKDKEGETDDEDDEPKTDEPSTTPEDEGLTSMTEENSTEFQNPLFNKSELDSSENATGAPSQSETSSGQNSKPTEGEETDLPEETEGGFKSNAAVESNETAERAQQVSDQADELGGRAQSLLERLQSATGTEGGGAAADPIKKSVDPEVSSDPSDVGVDVTKNTATESAEVGGDALDGFEAASEASRIAMKEAGGSIAKNIAEKVGINVAEDIGGAALDAIPVIGEIAGVAQIFHGLFHEHKERLKERGKEAQAGIKIKAGGSVAGGGLDLGSVLPQGAAVAGLV